MLKTGNWILFSGLTALTSSCSGSAGANLATAAPGDSMTLTTYENEYGKIELVKENDSLWRTIFYDNEKIVFDTVMQIRYEYNLLPRDEYPFLQLHTSGIKMYSNRLQVYDFAGPAYMITYTGIPHLYDRPFYQTGVAVTVSDVIKMQKGGSRIDGIYLDEPNNYVNEYAHLTGTIKKEKYPREYYATPDGPQGMFNDTTIDHYRLVLHDYETEIAPKDTFTGRAEMIDHRMAFVWDYADSEVYYLDTDNTADEWPKEQQGKKITIAGVLVQFEEGRSVLKAWKILN
jgi:hypothetical protein